MSVTSFEYKIESTEPASLLEAATKVLRNQNDLEHIDLGSVISENASNTIKLVLQLQNLCVQFVHFKVKNCEKCIVKFKGDKGEVEKGKNVVNFSDQKSFMTHKIFLNPDDQTTKFTTCELELFQQQGSQGTLQLSNVEIRGQFSQLRELQAQPKTMTRNSLVGQQQESKQNMIPFNNPNVPTRPTKSEFMPKDSFFQSSEQINNTFAKKINIGPPSLRLDPEAKAVFLLQGHMIFYGRIVEEKVKNKVKNGLEITPLDLELFDNAMDEYQKVLEGQKPEIGYQF